jgi:hypothetical protein
VAYFKILATMADIATGISIRSASRRAAAFFVKNEVSNNTAGTPKAINPAESVNTTKPESNH